MTTYSYQVSFDDSEIIAVKAALEFYLLPEVQSFMEKNSDLNIINYFHRIKKIIDDKKLYENVDLTSTSSFLNREINLK